MLAHDLRHRVPGMKCVPAHFIRPSFESLARALALAFLLLLIDNFSNSFTISIRSIYHAILHQDTFPKITI